MKRLLLMAIAIACYAYVIPRKSTANTAIAGKLVYASCASIVVQIQDPDYYHLAQNKWQRTSAKPEMQHVFMVKNSCAFLAKKITVGQTFSFKVLQNAGTNDGCVLCTMYDNPPTARLSILVTD
jgi:hypothetical protein